MAFVLVQEEDLSCPISFNVMKDPVIAEDGFIYEYEEIKSWFKISNVSPNTRQKMGQTFIRPVFMHKLLQEFCKQTNTEYTPIKNLGLITAPTPSPPKENFTVVNDLVVYLNEEKIRSKKNIEYRIMPYMRNNFIDFTIHLDQWTVDEMKRFLRMNGIPCRAGWKKNDIVAYMTDLLFL